MKKTTLWSGVLSASLFALSAPALPGINEHDYGISFSAVPYVFKSEDWGTAGGASGIVKGLFQPQLAVFATGIVSDNGSWLGFVGMNNLMIPGFNQWLVDVNLLSSYYDETNYYVSGHPGFPDEQAGSNDSSADNFIRTSGRESHYQFRLRYVLPIGGGTDGALAGLMHRKGETTSDSCGQWNPFENGFTTLEFQPFYQRQDLGKAIPEEDDTTVTGLRIQLDYDNRDSSQEPTQGSHLKFTNTHGFENDTRASWSTWELGFSQFYNLGASALMREQVVALNAWVADTPTWNDMMTINGETEYRRPSSFAGISMGGLTRLRGYATNRFHGRSAVSYSAEYRVKPQWQPLQGVPLLGDWYDLPWWQWIVFVDVGRVADTFSASELHTDMKYNVGAGIRFKAEGVTGRVELAAGEEGSRLVAFINQPF